MNKLLTTAIIGAVLSTSGFASGATKGTIVANNNANITVTSKLFDGVNTVVIGEGGTLNFEVDADINANNTLKLADGAIVNLNGHTVNNAGTITIEYGNNGLILAQNGRGAGSIKQTYSDLTDAVTSNIIITGTSTKDIASVKLVGASTGDITVTQGSNPDVYRAYLTDGQSPPCNKLWNRKDWKY